MSAVKTFANWTANILGRSLADGPLDQAKRTTFVAQTKRPYAKHYETIGDGYATAAQALVAVSDKIETAQAVRVLSVSQAGAHAVIFKGVKL